MEPIFTGVAAIIEKLKTRYFSKLHFCYLEAPHAARGDLLQSNFVIPFKSYYYEGGSWNEEAASPLVPCARLEAWSGSWRLCYW